MCECGCTSNDNRYWFPAPGGEIYVLTLTRGCVECDGPSGVSIERITKDDILWKHRQEFMDGKLKFEKWADSCGVAIVTGMLRHEFIKALTPHLIGCQLKEMDQIGAEVLLEEAYDDSVTKPHFPQKACNV